MDEKKVRELYAKASLMDVFNNLHSSKNGLSDEEAAKRLKKYGLNTIKKAATESEWRTFF